MLWRIFEGIFAMVLKHTDLTNAKKACDRISDLVYATSFFVGNAEIETDIELAIIPLDTEHSVEEFLALTLEALPQTGKLVPYIVCSVPELEVEEE